MKANLSVGIFQMDSVWNDPEANLEQLDQQLRKLDNIPDLLILPEMWSTGFVMNPHANINASTVDAMITLAAKYNIQIVSSLALYVDGAYRNRALIVSGEGIVFHYDKQYLFSPAGENQSYEAGLDCRSIDIGGWNTKLQICYDLRFPESVRDETQPDLLIYMANWPSPRIYQWKQLLIARAIENQCKVIGCNRVGTDQNGWSYPGESIVINHDGMVIDQLPQQAHYTTTSLIKSDMIDYREQLPFYKDKKDFK